MNHSTLIHSSIVNPAKPNLVKESSTDPQDTVTVDVPLLIRLLELAREELKSDVELHHVVERILSIRNSGTLTMSDYEKIAGPQPQEVEPNHAELESILKLAGI